MGSYGTHTTTVQMVVTVLLYVGGDVFLGLDQHLLTMLGNYARPYLGYLFVLFLFIVGCSAVSVLLHFILTILSDICLQLPYYYSTTAIFFSLVTSFLWLSSSLIVSFCSTFFLLFIVFIESRGFTTWSVTFLILAFHILHPFLQSLICQKLLECLHIQSHSLAFVLLSQVTT